MPEFTQYYGKLWHVLTELIQFVCLLLLFTDVLISIFNIFDVNRLHSINRNVQCSWVLFRIISNINYKS